MIFPTKAILCGTCTCSHPPEASTSQLLSSFLVQEVFRKKREDSKLPKIYQGLSLKRTQNTSTPVVGTTIFNPLLAKLFTSYVLTHHPKSSPPFCTFLHPKTAQKLSCFIFLASDTSNHTKQNLSYKHITSWILATHLIQTEVGNHTSSRFLYELPQSPPSQFCTSQIVRFWLNQKLCWDFQD